jgi:hypothetical protein
VPAGDFTVRWTCRPSSPPAGCRRHHEAQSFGGEDFLQLVGHVVVLARQQVLALVDDSHLTAEAVEHLAELKPDVAAADDDEVLGELAQLHQAGVGEIAGLLQPFNLGNQWARAGVDEDPLAFDNVIAHLQRVRAGEACMVKVELQCRPFGHVILLPGAERRDDLLLAFDHSGQVHADIRSAHAPARPVARVESHLCRGHHRLGRRAAGVDAGAAQVLRSISATFQPLSASLWASGLPPCPEADDDCVRRSCHESSSTVPTI